jgi:DNA oxidative demethylase
VTTAPAIEGPHGLRLFSGRVDKRAREALVRAVFDAAEAAPFYTPRMPKSGAPMSVRQTSFGPLGWVTDKDGGYRYQATHPETGRAWPAMPPALLELWNEATGYRAPPESCLINLYRGAAKMGLHVDADEDARDAPVLSVSLGDDALFRIGGSQRGDPTQSLKLRSGDVLVLRGPSRRCFHGVDRIMPGTSSLIPGGGRINLTLRRVTVA